MFVNPCQCKPQPPNKGWAKPVSGFRTIIPNNHKNANLSRCNNAHQQRPKPVAPSSAGTVKTSVKSTLIGTVTSARSVSTRSSGLSRNKNITAK